MKSMIRIALLTTAIVLIGAQEGRAFDGARRGFVLGGGMGGGMTTFEQELTIDFLTLESGRENKAAVFTDVHIGGGLSDTLVLTYTARVSWFSLSTLAGDVTIASGVGVVALTKYARTSAPSRFVRGGVGFSSWDTPFESDSGDTPTGLGALLTFGYEFRPHWAVELGATWGVPKIQEGRDEFRTDAVGLHLVLVGTAY